MGTLRKSIFLASVLLLITTLSVFAGGQPESSTTEGEVTLTIATVNNPDMKVMEQLSPQFTKDTGIKLVWVVLPENELRQKITEDVGLGAGKFDIVTIGMIEVQNWKDYGWISSLQPMYNALSQAEKDAYDIDDIMPTVREALTVNGQIYALPFYAETSILFYRKDLFKANGITVPDEPTWQQVYDWAAKLNDPSNGFYGIAIRGLPGWGENMAVFPTIVNSFGGRFFDENWNAACTEPEFREALEFYKNILKDVGEPGPTGVGFTEGLTLISQGNAAMWYDASVAAGFLANPKQSTVVGKIGYAMAPAVRKNNNGWLWAWSLAIESASQHKDEAFQFLTWATSKKYIEMVADENGWASIPPGTRVSTYENPKYKSAADFSDLVLSGITGADYYHPTLKPVPYNGVQFIQIPEWPSLGTEISQVLAAYISDQYNTDTAIAKIRDLCNTVAVEGGYQK